MNYPAPQGSHSRKLRIFNSRMVFVALSVFALLLAFTSGVLLNPTVGVKAAMAPLSGAIYTSIGDGTAVNHNIYNAKSDVYLNGGPQNQNGPGLPDGIYYF